MNPANNPQVTLWVTLNDVYSHPLLIASVVAVLAVWTYFSGQRVAKSGLRLRTALESIRETMIRTGEAADVARQYPALLVRFRAEPTVGDSWAAMDRTLLRPSGPDEVYRQTAPASEFFGLHLLTLAGADLRAARAQANALVGIGLVLTFMGLVLALKAAGGSLGAGDPGQVQQGLARLLGTAASKFGFSVAALILSLLSAAWIRWETTSTERSLAAFIAAVDRRLPPLTPQEVASETQALLRGDSASRRSENEHLADAIAARFDKALSMRLNETLQPLVAAISQLSGSLTESNVRALREMTDQFLDRLEHSSGSKIREATVGMERVGGHVSALAVTLAEIRDGLAGAGNDAALAIAQAASDGARRIADAAGATHISLKTAGIDWERSATQAAALMRDGIQEATGALGSSLSAGADVLGERFGQAANRASIRVEEAARKIEERLARAATDAGREIRSAGGVIAASGKEAAAALLAGGVDATEHLSGAADLVKEAATVMGVEAKALAANLREWGPVSGEAAAMVTRVAAVLDAAAARMTEEFTAQEVLSELRSATSQLARIRATYGDAQLNAVPAEAAAAAPSHAGEE